MTPPRWLSEAEIEALEKAWRSLDAIREDALADCIDTSEEDGIDVQDRDDMMALVKAAPALLAQARSALRLKMLDADWRHHTESETPDAAAKRLNALESERDRLAAAEQERDERHKFIERLTHDFRATRIRAIAAEQERDRYRAALEDVFSLIESGYLCRDISRDHEPDWALKQVEPVMKLKRARAALRPDPQPGEEGTK